MNKYNYDWQDPANFYGGSLLHPRKRTVGQRMVDWWDDWNGVIYFFCAMSLCAFGVVSCANSKWYQAHLEAEAAQERVDAQPRVIREFEGCKVYAFKAGSNWQYVTRCPESRTATDWTTTQSCGKACTKTIPHHTETVN